MHSCPIPCRLPSRAGTGAVLSCSYPRTGAMIWFGRSFSRRQKTAARAFSALRCRRSCSIAPAGRRGAVCATHTLSNMRATPCPRDQGQPVPKLRCLSQNYGVCLAVAAAGWQHEDRSGLCAGKGASPASRALFADGILSQRARSCRPLSRSTLGARGTIPVRRPCALTCQVLAVGTDAQA